MSAPKNFFRSAVARVSSEELQQYMKMTRPTKAYISLDNLEENLRSFYHHVGSHSGAQLLPIIKANGYGHGALALAVHSLQVKNEKNENLVAGVSVATLEEAILLRQQLTELNIPCPLLLLLGVLPEGTERIAIQNNITPSICSIECLDRVIDAAKEEKQTAKVHIKLDTGMCRVGVCVSKDLTHFASFATKLATAVQEKYLETEGIYTHLSKADEINEESKEFTRKQLEEFQIGLSLLQDQGLLFPFIHNMNSAGSIEFKDLLCHAESLPFLKDLNLFRIGISLYGLYPSSEVKENQEHTSEYTFPQKLKPLMQWETQIVQIKELKDGDRVGYGGVHLVEGSQKIAVLPVGYADGYRRLLGAGNEKGNFWVEIKGEKCPIVGRVCMDMIMVDISHLDVGVGEKVVLMGCESSTTCEEMAAHLSTINYEITCLVGERVPRIYEKGGKIVGFANFGRTALKE